METICIRVDSGLAQNIEEVMIRHHYSTKTDFVRDAIREKLDKLNREAAIRAVLALKGSSKKKTSDEELERIREEVGREIWEEHLRSVRAARKSRHPPAV